MPLLPVSHHTWQVLRAVMRTKRPALGHALRRDWSRKTKDGSFLTRLVEDGILVRVTGSAAAPFEATYSLTERGEYAAEYAAEYGECELPSKPRPVASEGSGNGDRTQPPKARKKRR